LKTAAFVGRFQPFHRGHKKVVEEYSGDYDLKILIGSSEKEGEEKNPLSFEERKKLIELCFPDIEIIGIADEDGGEEGNKRWMEKLKEKSDAEIVISRNNLVKELVREDEDLELVEQEHYRREIYSGTEIRRRVRSGGEWRYLVPECCEEDFREHLKKIRESGIQYDFEPGWKKENSYHDTFEK